MLLLLFVFLLLLLDSTLCCYTIHFKSKIYGTIEFAQLPADKYPSFNGRPIYYSENHELYIYHITEDDEFGRWVVCISLEDHDKAIAFIDSWAVTPYLTFEVGALPWTVFSNNEWVTEPLLKVECTQDETLYFEPSVAQAHMIAGFYVLRHHTPTLYGDRPIYSLINDHHPLAEHIFLHYVNGYWVIGDTVGKDSSLAHIQSDADSPREIPIAYHWKFFHADKTSQPEWIEGEVASHLLFSAHSSMDIYSTLREHRKLHHLPGRQEFYELRNGVQMPVIGFGTGGLHLEETEKLLTKAVDAGYRMFDLAREYNNEHIIPKVFADLRHSYNEDEGYHISSHLQRSDFFITTKVWPTELGFHATEAAIVKSLEAMETNYIDLYLIHWPECDHDVSWMHCDTVEDPHGTWVGSWHALEKAYAEGRVGAIGVSNFNMTLLESMAPYHETAMESERTPHATNYDYLTRVKVLPHVVQNWAEPGNVDTQVLYWCKEKKAVYQTYATLRNLHQLYSDRKLDIEKTLSRLSKKYRVSEYEIVLRYMTQLSLSVIPRTTNIRHMQANLDIQAFTLTHAEIQEIQSIPNI